MKSNVFWSDLLGLELCQAKFLGNHPRDVFLGHKLILLSWGLEDAAAPFAQASSLRMAHTARPAFDP